MDLNTSLESMLGSYGIETSEEQIGLLMKHLELLAAKNETLNLTRVDSGEEALIAHILDSLLSLPCLRSLMGTKRCRLLDIGTGGGFPGLPLAIMTGWESVLIDSVGKKVAAVESFVSELGLCEYVQALHIRAEELARQQPESFDVVVTRAVAQSNVLLEYASPLLARGGYLVLYKARPSDDELLAAARAAKLCGMELVSRETFELPNDSGHREIFFYKKTAKPKLKLPRRTGLASKEPLGL